MAQRLQGALEVDLLRTKHDEEDVDNDDFTEFDRRD